MTKPIEYDDPMEPIGVELPAGKEAMRAMAYVFGEEFARLGFDETRLLRLFRNPFYAGPHRALRALGDRAVEEIVAECVGIWGRRQCGMRDGEGEVEGEPAIKTPDSALRTPHSEE